MGDQKVGQRYVGASVGRSEDRRVLTGQGTYIDDVQIPGMVHAAFVRSPSAHARITSIDPRRAREARGVVAVYTGVELQALVPPGVPPITTLPGLPGPEFTVLATDKVRLVGDLVAIVVAETRYLAEDACELVEVEYDELPPVATIETALDPSSTPVFESLGDNVLVRPKANAFGDVEDVFARADRVVTASIAQHRHQNVPMECRGGIYSFDHQTGELSISAATQGVHHLALMMAHQFDLAPDKVTVLAGDVGGSFGLKQAAAREDVACALVARDIGRTIKWVEDRTENLVASGQARDERADLEAAITDDGELLGLKVRLQVDTGAYTGIGAVLPSVIERMIPGPYKLRALSFESSAVVTNKASYVAYRGPWAMETFARERLLDIIADNLGIEPLELRLRNVVTGDEPGIRMVTGGSLAGATARKSLERMAELVDLAAFRGRQVAAREERRYLGIGMATFIEEAPGPRAADGTVAPKRQRYGRRLLESTPMRLEQDGTVTLFTTQMPHGQGHETTLAQVAADELGVAFEDVTVVVGDTRAVPFGFGTGGSMAATMAGGAALHTARALRAKVLAMGSHLLEASVDDMELDAGVVSVRGVPARGLSLAAVARAAREPGRFPADLDTTLEAAEPYDGGEGGWSGGTHCAVVEIDVETGLVRIERYLVVEDCGELINPAIVDGQVRGGVAQGIGAVLFERSAYDPDTGQFLAGTFMDYLLPTAYDIPRIEIEHLATVPLDADVNFRGVGEGGMIVAPATLCNAIEDALKPFGVRVAEQHLPPQRILELIGTLDT